MGVPKKRLGNIILYASVFGAIAFSLVILGITSFAILENKSSLSKRNREGAIEIAEAGINYYRWHLNQSPTDYQDLPLGGPGPYVHAYTDKNGVIIGHYSLVITGPTATSSLVSVVSTGWADAQPNVQRTLKAKFGYPALTDYALLTNAGAWINSTTVIHGKVHANGGIKFDGIGDAPISSAVGNFTCQISQGCVTSTVQNGIWGVGSKDFWTYPVPSKDMSVLSSQLGSIKTSAAANGIYLRSSGMNGWYIKFNSDGTVSYSRVKKTTCYGGQETLNGTAKSFCVDAASMDTVTTTKALSATNGYIYVEDQVWVDGTVNGRATIGTAPGKQIIINGNILYSAKDGSCALGLVADKDVVIPKNSPVTMEIDAAIYAKNGAALMYYYPIVKTSLTIYGSIVTNDFWRWSWMNASGTVISGYNSVTLNYDRNLYINPPSGFPVGSTYGQVSWDEVKAYGAVLTNVPVMGVTISPTSTAVQAGNAVPFLASINPSNATNQNVTWSILSGGGTLTPNGLGASYVSSSVGTAKIQAAVGGFTASSTITVTGATLVTGIGITPLTASVMVGGQLSFIATTSPSNASNQVVTWSVTSGAASGSIDPSSGSFTATNVPGSVTIQAAATDGSGVVGTATVNVYDPGVLGLDPGFPVTLINTSSVNTVDSPSFSTTAGNRLLVAVVTWALNTPNINPALSGAGQSWTLQKSSTGSDSKGVQVWTAWASGALSSQTVSVNKGTTNPVDLTVAVYAFNNASQTLGAVGGRNNISTSVPIDATVVATAPGSWIVGGFAEAANASNNFSPLGNTTFDVYNPGTAGIGDSQKIGHLTAPTAAAGAVTWGSSAASTWVGTAAIEVLTGVGNVSVTGVTMWPVTSTLTAYGTQLFSAAVTPANATNQNINWSVTPSTGAGTITALTATTSLFTAPGVAATSTVTATSQNNGYHAYAAVTTTVQVTSNVAFESACQTSWLSNTTTTISTSPVTGVQAGDTIVVIGGFVIGGSNYSWDTIPSDVLSVSGGTVSNWVYQNGASNVLGGPPPNQGIEIFTGTAGAAGNYTVTWNTGTENGQPVDRGLTVCALKGVTGIGSAASFGGTLSGPLSIQITPSKSGSLVLMGGAYNGGIVNTAWVAGSNALMNYGSGTGQPSSGSQVVSAYYASTTVNSAITVGESSPSITQWTSSVGAIEFLGNYTVVPVTNIAVSPSPATVIVNDTLQLSASLTPAIATDKTVTWSVVGGATNGIIVGNGLNATYTAPASAGSATIHAQTTNGTAVDIPVTIIASGIDLDPGFPVSKADNSTNHSTFTTPSFSTAGPNRKLVAVVVWNSQTAGVGNPSVTGAGLSWNPHYSTGGDWEGAAVWTAWAPTVLTSQAVTVSRDTSGNANDYMVTVYALSGAKQTDGSFGFQEIQGTAGVFNAVVNAPAVGSWIIGGFGAQNSTLDFPALANTVWDFGDVDYFRHMTAKAGHLMNPTTSTGNVTMGTSASLPYSESAALEIMASSTIPVTSVTVTPTTSTIVLNGTQQFTVNILPVNATNQAVTWSKVSGIGSISGTGLYTGSATGTAVVRATTLDGTNLWANATTTVTSSMVSVTSVTLAPVTSTVIVTHTQQFTATILPTSSTNKTVSWGVAGGAANGTINGTGLYTAPTVAPVTPVIVNVTTTDGNKVATSTVTVYNNVWYLNPTAVTASPGIPVAVTGTFSTGTVRDVIWSTTAYNAGAPGAEGGNSTYGTIDSSGNYTAPSGASASTTFARVWTVSRSNGTANWAPVSIASACVSAKFGIQTPGTIAATGPYAGGSRINRYTTTENGQITSVSYYIDPGGTIIGGTHMKGVIYTDSSGSPTTLMGVSNPVTVVGGWNTMTFSTPVSFSTGPIWIGATTDQDVPSLITTGGTAATTQMADPPPDQYINPLATWAGAGSGNIKSVYATYTPGSCAANYQFGKTTIGGSPAGFPWMDNASLSQFTLPQSGQVTSLTVYYSVATSTAKIKGLIYSSSGSNPYILQGTTIEKIGVVAGWNTLTFSSAIPLTAGNYFLGVISDSDLSNGVCDVAGTNWYEPRTYSSGPLATWDTGVANVPSSYQKSIYATYH